MVTRRCSHVKMRLERDGPVEPKKSPAVSIVVRHESTALDLEPTRFELFHHCATLKWRLPCFLRSSGQFRIGDEVAHRHAAQQNIRGKSVRSSLSQSLVL